jgi:anhydro-N-acetylmuramic acid kinase
MNGADLMLLHCEYGERTGKCVRQFIEENRLPDPDIIASHGQTVFHRPEAGMTFQLGSGAHIAAVTGIDTVCDFRIQDVALGGQGAPLVPVGDKILFGAYDYCLNIGGFANISYDNEKGERVAFDVVPANIVLNHYAAKKGLKYDEDGKLAATGKIVAELLDALNANPYFERPLPKSLGWETVEKEIIPLIDGFNASVEDVLRTYVEHIAIQIGRTAKRGKMLVTGGGALNGFLMERIRRHTQAGVIIPDKETVMFKEALVFALLGYLRIKNRINVLKSVTGARKDHVAGIVYKK